MGNGVTLKNLDDSVVLPSGMATYMGASGAFTPPATPTDLFYIAGVTGKIIKIWKLGFSSQQTTAGVNRLCVVKRNAANTAGTFVATTKVPMDSLDPASNAVVQHYTANPTINGTVGNLWCGLINSPAPATAGIGGLCGVELEFTSLFGKPITLRGAAEALAWNFLGAGLPVGLSPSCWVEWSEEG